MIPKTVLGLGFLCVSGLIGYSCYRLGYTKASEKVAADYSAEYANDWNTDPSVKHSDIYSLGYARGHAKGSGDTRQKDSVECGDRLAQLAVEAGNMNVTAKWLAEYNFAPSQLKEAIERVRSGKTAK